MKDSHRDSRTVVVDGAAVQAAREGQYVTQGELAAEAHVTKRTIEKIEKGGRAFRATIRDVAAALGVDPNALIVGARPGSRPPSDVPHKQEGEERSASTREPSSASAHSATVLIDLYKEFKGLRKALSTVWNDPLERFDDDLHDEYRRDVLHFWELVASLAKDPDIEKRLLDRYRDQVSVWERLKPIQIRATAQHVILKRHPELSQSEATAWATREVSTSDVEWLYNRWKSRRRSHFRDDDS